MTGVKAVNDLRHGDVRVVAVPECLNDVEMTRETYLAVAANGMMPRVWDFVEAHPAGVYTLPVVALEPDAVEDTRNAVTLVEHEISPHCALPHCQQDVSDTSRGFSLCATHASHMTEWDDLLAS